ncbi:MAG: GNAT family N-acetyltransferase [Ignavibacteria bacterium]|nr:GNAT family N-acetyltransferase [Ignavibacteria bacterium]MBK7254114.1 GNAT family N-acetyltransferase [Ignavibacteria bacterium]MBK7446906.1 GNAT family N-acetyltransferase [Ignavibacteria bacterium]MBK9405376.1 GNAT family N-acetyltransferase [Ignavibacteria bacterium]MBL0108269.1 GNAT family N-acetyltransferase [Ignavibacteria bacterium]
MDIAFKVMKISMYEELVNLWKNNEGIRLSVGDTKDELDKYLKRNRGMSYVCIDKNQNKIAGSILCGHDGRRGYIYHLAVSKKFRKNNIAKSLIERSLSKLKKSGIRRCILMVDDLNISAKDFWLNAGWRRRTDLEMFSLDIL